MQFTTESFCNMFNVGNAKPRQGSWRADDGPM